MRMNSIVGLSLLLWGGGAAARGEIIDRIAVSVGNRVVTTSDIDRQIRVAAFVDGRTPDLSAAARKAAAERLIDQKLIQRELETSRYPAATAAEVDPALAKFRQEHMPDDAVYRRTLAEYGLTELDLREEILWQRTFLLFTGQRFHLTAQISEEEIRDYYDKAVKPSQAAGAAPPLEDARAGIEATLSQEREEREMQSWLDEARKRTAIVYHEEAFQ